MIGVVIPAFNEEQLVAQVVHEVRGLGLPVIVVDDGSTDATAHRAEEAGAVVMSMPLRAGAWGASQAGLKLALQMGWQHVVTMDADGQHLADSLPALLAASQHSDVVIGACPQRASRLRHLAWGLFRSLSGLIVRDLTSGLRVYNRRAVRILLGATATMADYQDVAILLLLQANGLRLCEIPVPMRARADGKSRIFSSWGRVILYMLCTTLLSWSRRCNALPNSTVHRSGGAA